MQALECFIVIFVFENSRRIADSSQVQLQFMLIKLQITSVVPPCLIHLRLIIGQVLARYDAEPANFTVTFLDADQSQDSLIFPAKVLVVHDRVFG